MRIPRTPPSLLECAERMAPEERAVSLDDIPVSDARYFHWDDLRHRKPPAGLSTREAWWVFLRAKRADRHQLPLQDREGFSFNFHQTARMSAILWKIDLNAGGTIAMPEPVTNQSTRDYYYISSLMNEAITSSQLEGAAVTREVARELLRTQRRPRDTGERMILNNYRTMQRLEALKTQPLTPEIVFEIHRLITEDTLSDPTAAGRFRRPDEDVDVVDTVTGETLHSPPPAEELPRRLERLCDFANDTSTEPVFVHPVLRAIILHFMLAYDHPFVDGNGRTARALFYWLVLRRNYWLFQFISISEILVQAPAQYGRAFLLTETDSNDLNYFILHQLSVIERAFEGLQQFIERKTRELSETGPLLRRIEGLNHRQEAILNRALREPGARFSILAHQRSNQIAYATARADLLGLEALGLFTKVKRGKGYDFAPVRDLRRRLEELGGE